MKVICLSCKEEVLVKVTKYGNGYIAKCPKYGDLAYNSKKTR